MPFLIEVSRSILLKSNLKVERYSSRKEEKDMNLAELIRPSLASD